MSDGFIGEIRVLGGTTIPRGWVPCDGRSLSISQNDVLFSLLGVTYGGDGVTTFNVPDLRGRLPIGMGDGPGLTSRPVGQTVGQASVTLTTANLPSHNHVLQGSTATASTGTPTTSSVLALSESNVYDNGALENKQIALADAAISPAGTAAATAHDNTMPSLALSYIIALEGIYPQRT